MKIYPLLSFTFIFVSFILILNIPINLTGNIINTNFTTGNIFFGILFLVFGIALLLIHGESRLEKNLAQQIKESGRIIDKPKELIHIANKMGYILKEPVREGVPVYDISGKNYLTVIPLHKITWRTSKDIIRDLAEGKPSIKRRNYS